MVSLIDVVHLLKTEIPELNVYPLEFPLKSPTSSVVVDMSGNATVKAGVFPINVQIKVREDHPTKGETTSFNIRKLLENKTNFPLGDTQVVLVKSVNPVPLYMGKDTESRYLYSNNFTFTINEGDI
ncbi:minor capsid protein [Priestia aryabhattai]|uniref:phage tail terminator protein n=1 Tax=Priestia aryabhattai TaxID=412384 RepID=UPI003D2B6E97